MNWSTTITSLSFIVNAIYSMSLAWWHMTFFHLPRNEESGENESKFCVFFEEMFFWKWLNRVPKDTYCYTLIHKNGLEIGYDHDTGVKLENLNVQGIPAFRDFTFFDSHFFVILFRTNFIIFFKFFFKFFFVLFSLYTVISDDKYWDFLIIKKSN